MVSVEATRRKYRGAYAAGYREKRVKQERWHLENEIVTEYLSGLPRNSKILDVPVGEGRFLPLYDTLKLKVTGIDVSEMMLKRARVKKGGRDACLHLGDLVSGLRYPAKTFDAAVCVRFLDLIPEDAMRSSLFELTRLARKLVVLTIRLGARYEPKANTATHNMQQFYRSVKQLEWRVEDETPIFKQGWRVIKLGKR